MGKAFNVSDNIGFDGSSYFCRRCGKAGYERGTQVRGHLAMCPGTLARKGVLPATSSNQLQPLVSGSGVGLGATQLPRPVVVADPVANPPADNYQELERRVLAIENHYNHFLMDRNQPPSQYQPAGQDFFSQYKGIIIVGAIIVLAIIVSKQSNQCAGSSTGKGVNVGDIGGSALKKLVDTGITKGVASLFK